MKVIFNVRNDSDTMFSHFNISLNGVMDLQIMVYLQTRRLGRNPPNLHDCVMHDRGVISEELDQWSSVKKSVLDSIRQDKVTDLSDLPTQRRPLTEGLLLYAAGDIEYPSLSISGVP